MQLLRAFLGGTPNLTNAELSDRSGLPRPTVSRLTRSLVDGGFLEFDPAQSVYRLAPVCLSLAAGYHHGHSAFDIAIPLLREAAQRERVNIGLAVRDGEHVVYLASFREGRGPIKRVVSAGFRARIEAFSVGHALIATLPPTVREQLLDQLAQTCGANWPVQRERIALTMAQYQRLGYCTLDSVPGLVAFSTALQTPDGAWCAIVLTVQDREVREPDAPDLPKVLMGVALAARQAWPRP